MKPTAEEAVSMSLIAPYVGLRPYERHESDLLTGRSKDARFLADKVFSARLTLLYSPSGLGKSSLLRALVIPELEDDACRTLYLDAWAGEEPEIGVRKALQSLAASLGLADVLEEAAPLLDWVRLVTADRHTLVLVLDQFEEFLLNHAQRLDPLRKELAILVRAPDLDLRLLVALREEFLANLEPFREEVVNLFQSTYRLEPLDSKAVREAIRAPAEHFGVEYEPALLDQLVADLEVRPTIPAPGQGTAAADLPMLQIVCLELWNAAEAKRLKTLTRDFYLKAQGGAQAILDAYVRKVMPRRWRDRLFSARLMKYLAPPSGLKISYSVSDLAAMSGLDSTRIEAELRRLGDKSVRIVRMRDFKSGQRFELQHDALIPRIAPWRDSVLARLALLKRCGWLALILAAVAIGVGGPRVYDEYELYSNTEKPLAEMNCNDPQQVAPKFDYVAGYLVGNQRGEEVWDRLRVLMQSYHDCMPANYGIDTSGYEIIQPVPPGENWPLVLRLAEEREFDETAFLQSWYGVAASLTERWAVPVPRRIAIVRDPSFPNNLVRLESDDGGMKVEIEVADPSGEALVELDYASALAQAFHERFRSESKDWRQISKEVAPGNWWAVPRWSLPAWKAAGVKAYPPSVVVALALESRLSREPGILLTDGAVRYLVARLAEQYPDTAGEAILGFSHGLIQNELGKMLAHGQGLRHFLLAVDGLAGIHADRLSATVETFAQRGYLATLQLSSRETLSGPTAESKTDPCEPGPAGKTDEPRFVAYREMEPWLPQITVPVRALIGNDLVRSWVPDHKELAPWVQEMIAESRDIFFENTGVSMPGIRFRETSYQEPIGASEFKLGLLELNEVGQPAVALPSADKAGLETLLRTLIPQINAARAAWLIPEVVTALLEGLSPELRQWLKEHYSVSDLTLILRAVLLPDSPDEPGQISGNRSLRHPEWLLGGLVAWDAAPGAHPREVGDIAEFLRKLQQARLDATASVSPPTAAGPIAKAVDELSRGRVQSARRRLAEAVGKNGTEQTREMFVRLYAASHRSTLLSAAEKEWCRDPINPSSQDLNRLRADLKDLLSQSNPPLPRERARHLELCRVAAYPEGRLDKQVAQAAALAAVGGTPDSWPTAHALWLGQKILKYYNPVRDPTQWLQQGATLLGSALRRLPDTERDAAFDDLLAHCAGNGPHAWCWGLAQELAGRFEGDPWVALIMANSLSDRVDTVGLKVVLDWITEGERRIKAAPLPKEVREQGLRGERWLRANVRLEAAEPTDTETLAQLEQEMVELSGLGPPFDEMAHTSLTQIMLHKRQSWGNAEKSARKGMEKWSENVFFYNEAFLAALMQYKQEAVSEIAERAEKKVNKLDEELFLSKEDKEKRDEFLFLAALGHILMREEHWEELGRKFLQTQHKYVNIIAMLLHNRMSGSAAYDAKALIDKRWRTVDQAKWQRRMEEGDESAWIEMLLGFYLGQVKPEQILPVLENDTAYAASEFAKLPIPRAGLLSDAYFYDALSRESRKDVEGMKRSLRQVIKIGATDYYEYFMASYLRRDNQPAQQQD